MDPLNSKKEEEKAVESNCFSKPWKNSDIALVVEGVELHVHRTILCLQSPVFEAMLNGDFKEAKQDKITLEGKDPDEMINFLKLLYPSKTFDNPLNEENLAAILALADEYQTEAVIKQCFDDATLITPATALRILPYACKHDQLIREKCIKLAQKQIKCQNLKENTADLDQDLREEILTGKCELLEDTLMKANERLVSCMHRLNQYQGMQAKYVSGRLARCCFSHQVEIQEFYKARKCGACLLACKEKFCDTITQTGHGLGNFKWNTQILEFLEEMDDLLSQRTKRN